ncbi:protein canopy homolog 4 [Alligator sinensis]|uniref:Protein canopy homolog 4 n=1 Tax=Alligator sinensis TaxID=38654 RepID=A0A3Q0H5K9_ALLSI|nr:protein canopy homolog 4 [Alligator sinensis]
MGALGLPLLALLLGAWAGAPTPCEVRKYLSLELEAVLASSARSAEVLELGQVLDSGRRPLQRLGDASGRGTGEWLLQCSIHTECPGSLRYAKVSRFPPAPRGQRGLGSLPGASDLPRARARP